jgi:hypothetical protein
MNSLSAMASSLRASRHARRIASHCLRVCVLQISNLGAVVSDVGQYLVRVGPDISDGAGHGVLTSPMAWPGLNLPVFQWQLFTSA